MTSYDVCLCISPTLIPRLSPHANEKNAFPCCEWWKAGQGLGTRLHFTLCVACLPMYVHVLCTDSGLNMVLVPTVVPRSPIFITYSCNDCSVFNMHVAMDQELDGRKDSKWSYYDNYKEEEWASIHLPHTSIFHTHPSSTHIRLVHCVLMVVTLATSPNVSWD